MSTHNSAEVNATTPSHVTIPEQQKVGSIGNANFPTDAEGRVYHVGVKVGEVANRILSVGDPNRAKRLAAQLDPGFVFQRASNRGYVVYTGKKDGVPVTIIATGMGVAMMDFLVREVRGITRGPLVIVRFGTCGCLDPNIPIGSIAVSDSSVLIQRNPDAFRAAPNSTVEPYLVSQSVNASPDITNILTEQLRATLGEARVPVVQNATGDSFYSSQGRQDANFDDRNSTLIDDVATRLPRLKTLEMETFHLFDLASIAQGPAVHAGAAVIVLADRKNNRFLDNDAIRACEEQGGGAVLRALAAFPLPVEEIPADGVWNNPSTDSGEVAAH